MWTIRKFCSCNDLLGFTSVNLDHLTITTEMSLYLTWLAKWSDYCHVAVAPGNRIIGYSILGAAEEQAQGVPWQGLVQSVNVAFEYRRQKLATRLMQTFEKQLVEKMRVSPWYHRYFVCLYVGVNNTPAREMFEQLGYAINRSMPEYLSDNEDTLYLQATMSNYWNYFIELSDFCHVAISPGELNHGFRTRKALGEEQEGFQFVNSNTSFRVQEPAL